ncbi:transforming acidic coiled-coil-containing protein 1 isoform X6 [Canis lupus familiaris]|uniref:transforming acidic coiled-coil-containing protein 1 isoform X6 n=2 Tax=Canis lupus TaxID=9612 RepID=UPI00005A30E1|nr:transforming acidic coiled-coil-containing protein 1 isoform X6 [Canis lupus familiaris]XP_025289373.1 transforming acidic coiled-coil-containing protein 1 isoform X6 [Canis lupus dingo]XP_038415967.1 transforming acidic coiled-coil-containing protein 1 isoform X6 [Canis lupus familiaris]XP_048950801.1 transforming acidic coiled-coil-containing protein 1 isoform X6 [Canis lupus dingo]|eukprot:XP_005629903.1 transforming acidic coiled-coil-containing protein 1 isoform X6 [Canis lupus familiaris]
MAFSPWQILSPVQWAKWTWSAVRGGGAGEEEAGGPEGDPEDEDSQAETKSLSFSSDSEGNFETPEAETPIRSPLKESRDSSLGLAGPEAKTQESQEVDEQLVAEVVEKCSSETCSRTSENEVAQQAVDSYLVKDFKEEPEHDSSRISVVRPFSIEAKNSTNIPAALGTRAAYGCVTVVSGEASPSSIPEAILDKAMTEGTMGVTLETSTESDLKAGSSSPEPVPSRSKLRKPKPVPLRKKTIGEFLETDIALEGTPLPQASYQFCPDEMDGNTSSLLEGARIQKSPPDTKETSSTPSSDTNDSGVELLEESRNSPLKLEFDFTEDVENIESRKGLPRKVGRKLGSKLPPKVQKDSINKPVGAKGVDQPADPAADSAPPSQASAKLDPSQWDSPNFNPFGGHSTLQNSPLLSSKGSYHFDESMDPFKPTTTLASSDFCSAGNHINEILESPKKAKSRLITSGCKVKKYETQSLALDGCSQDEGAVISQISDISNRDGHATDEEKLASTSSGQKSAGAEVKGIEKEMCQKMEKDGSAMTGLLESSMEKAPVSVACEGESPLDGICLSESDKTAVLTLIREEIITKEIEANEWKKKYEETRQEVLEMRKIVAEYEKTIAQMIEDEQRTSMTSQKSFQQLTMEKEQALADLNSVERSLSDLFRRYENLKGVLEGFKKNEEALKKCAQDYLARVKQEEQRYQALKIHAEEKLDKANEEIAQVRTKAKAESAALHAGLRKEQMKVESLERALQQKNQEIEELTKICDELIAKLGKTD